MGPIQTSACYSSILRCCVVFTSCRRLRKYINRFVCVSWLVSPEKRWAKKSWTQSLDKIFFHIQGLSFWVLCAIFLLVDTSAHFATLKIFLFSNFNFLKFHFWFSYWMIIQWDFGSFKVAHMLWHIQCGTSGRKMPLSMSLVLLHILNLYVFSNSSFNQIMYKSSELDPRLFFCLFIVKICGPSLK